MRIYSTSSCIFVRIVIKTLVVTSAVLTILFMIACVVCTFNCMHCHILVSNFNPFQQYYLEKVEANFRVDNRRRLEYAAHFLRDQQNKSTYFTHHPTLIITVITKKRNIGRDKYLSQTMARLLMELEVSSRKFIQPALCIVGGDDSSVDDEVAVWKPFVPFTVQDKRNNDDEDILESERHDYEYCLRWTINSYEDATFILLLEDDSLPINNFVLYLEELLQTLRDRVRLGVKDVAFVKLFHPYRLRKIPFLFHAFVFSVLIVVTIRCLFVLACARKFNFLLTLWSTFYSLMFLYQILGVYFFLVLLGPIPTSIIRQSVTSKSVYLGASESCCTPAVLFPVSNVNIVLSYLSSKRSSTGYAKDHILDEIPRVYSSLTVLLTDTNLVQHIGRFTNLRAKPIPVQFLN